jgi:hypothetical protein
MAEWLKAAVLKTAFPPGNGGSNPSPSATQIEKYPAISLSPSFDWPLMLMVSLKASPR